MEKERVERTDRRNRKSRKKVCAFCMDKIEHIDYKDVPRLRRYLSDRAKIIPRRVTGTCARHQRQLTVAVKRARHLAFPAIRRRLIDHTKARNCPVSGLFYIFTEGGIPACCNPLP